MIELWYTQVIYTVIFPCAGRPVHSTRIQAFNSSYEFQVSTQAVRLMLHSVKKKKKKIRLMLQIMKEIIIRISAASSDNIIYLYTDSDV